MKICFDLFGIVLWHWLECFNKCCVFLKTSDGKQYTWVLTIYADGHIWVRELHIYTYTHSYTRWLAYFYHTNMWASIRGKTSISTEPVYLPEAFHKVKNKTNNLRLWLPGYRLKGKPDVPLLMGMSTLDVFIWHTRPILSSRWGKVAF